MQIKTTRALKIISHTNHISRKITKGAAKEAHRGKQVGPFTLEYSVASFWYLICSCPAESSIIQLMSGALRESSWALPLGVGRIRNESAMLVVGHHCDEGHRDFLPVIGVL